MLARLIALSLSQRLLVLVLAALMAAAGVQAFRALPIDAFPDVSGTQVKLILKAPGMTPEEVEARIVAPIEQELLGIPRQAVLRSQSKYAIADITLDFQEGTDVFWARQQVSERLAGVLKDLPASVSGGLAPITTPLGEMFMFTIEGPLSLMEKRTLLEWTIRPQLRNIAGVADVNSLGGMVRSFEVVPDLAALAARGLSLAQLQQALEANNRSDGAGRLGSGEEALLVRSDAGIRTLDDVRAIGIDAARRHGGERGPGGHGAHRPADALRRRHAGRARRSRAGAGAGHARRECAASGAASARPPRCAGPQPAQRHPHQHLLRPRQAGGAGRGQRHGRPGRSHRAGDRAADCFSGQLALGAGGRLHPAAGGAGHLPADAGIWPERQPDVAGRPGHRHRHAGRCGRRGGGKHRGPWRPCPAGRAAPAPHLPGRARSGPARQRRHAGDHDRLPAPADPAGPGRQAVRPRGADHPLRAGRLAAAVADRHSRARLAAAVRTPRGHAAPGAENGSGLPGSARARPAPRAPGRRRGRGGAAAGRRRLPARGQIVHAHAGRRRHHHADRKTALREPAGIGAPGPGHPAPHPGTGARGAAHRGAPGVGRTGTRSHGPERNGLLPRAQAARAMAQRGQGSAGRCLARGHGKLSRRQHQLYPAHRNAHLGNAVRRARRRGRQDLRPGQQGAGRAGRAHRDAAANAGRQ